MNTTANGTTSHALSNDGSRPNDRVTYSSGNYEAFARPRMPRGVEEKSANLVAVGLALLAAAVLLIRDGQMDGKRITILEAAKLSGDALDRTNYPHRLC